MIARYKWILCLDSQNELSKLLSEKIVNLKGSDSERFVDQIIHWFPIRKLKVCSTPRYDGTGSSSITVNDLPVHKNADALIYLQQEM
jgi:hypothetical protein